MSSEVAQLSSRTELETFRETELSVQRGRLPMTDLTDGRDRTFECSRFRGKVVPILTVFSFSVKPCARAVPFFIVCT